MFNLAEKVELVFLCNLDQIRCKNIDTNQLDFFVEIGF